VSQEVEVSRNESECVDFSVVAKPRRFFDPLSVTAPSRKRTLDSFGDNTG
jgi:hypothetical protein